MILQKNCLIMKIREGRKRLAKTFASWGGPKSNECSAHWARRNDCYTKCGGFDKLNHRNANLLDSPCRLAHVATLIITMKSNIIIYFIILSTQFLIPIIIEKIHIKREIHRHRFFLPSMEISIHFHNQWHSRHSLK